MSSLQDHKTWTVAEVKARLSELLRLVREEGPQYISLPVTSMRITGCEMLVSQGIQKILTSPLG